MCLDIINMYPILKSPKICVIIPGLENNLKDNVCIVILFLNLKNISKSFKLNKQYLLHIKYFSRVILFPSAIPFLSSFLHSFVSLFIPFFISSFLSFFFPPSFLSFFLFFSPSILPTDDRSNLEPLFV